MLKKANISWNARQLSKMIAKETIRFDSAIQRNLVWDNDRKSLLIHSMIEGYPIPAMYAVRDTENKNYQMLDGKQRSNAIADFLGGKFTLSNVPVVTLEDGTEVDINGKYFSGLDEDMQDIVNNYSLTVYYFEDISDDEANELFFRINNGKALTTYERFRTRSKTLPEIQKVAAHDYFRAALDNKKIESRVNEDWVLKSYIMMTYKEPCLDSKITNPAWVNTKLTDDDINNLNAVYSRILNVYNTIIADESAETGKLSKKIATRLLKKTHMFSIVPITKRSIEEGVTDEVFTFWVKNFFCGTKKSTKYEEYNIRCGAGNGHAENIKVRLDTVKKDYEKFMKQYKTEAETETNENNTSDIVSNAEVSTDTDALSASVA